MVTKAAFAASLGIPMTQATIEAPAADRAKSRVFYALLVTQSLSLIGSRMTALAIGIWLFATTGAATPLVLVSFFAFLPRLVSASLAGLLADRWDRRLVMAIADAGQAAGTLLLLASFASGAFQLWHLYAVTMLQATFDIFQSPALHATVGALAADRQRNRANALMLITTPIAGIVAPTLTGALYGLIGVAGIIAVDLATFALSVAVLLLLPIPQPPPPPAHERGSLWQDVTAGFRFVWRNRPLLMVFVFTAATNFFYAGAIALNTPYILNRTGSQALLGALLSAYSAGTLAGTALMMVWRGRRRRVDTMMPVIALNGAALALYGGQTSPVAMAALLFVMALGSPINNVSILSTLQAKVPPALQGRVFAAINQISMVLIPLSYLLMGPLSDSLFEPLGRAPAWAAFALIFGSGPGAGTGLLFSICGVAIAAISLAIYALPLVQQLDQRLPDYAPSAAPAE
jgi:DHA3 family macrolide efflux protein-like MFS transporter